LSAKKQPPGKFEPGGCFIHHSVLEFFGNLNYTNEKKDKWQKLQYKNSKKQDSPFFTDLPCWN
jgi:hypothetical protein